MKWPAKRYRRSIGTAVLLGMLAAGCLAYVRHVNWASTLAVFNHAALPLLAAATGCHFVSLLAKAGVWLVCLRAVGAARFWTVARATLVGSTLNSLLVANSGEAGRVMIMTRASGLPAYAVLTTVALERLVNVGGFLVVLCVGALLAPLPLALSRGLVAIGLVGVVVVWLVSRWCFRARGRAVVDRARGRRFGRLLRVQVRRVARVARRIVTPRRLAIAGPLTLMDWLFQLASYNLVARAAHLPISVPGTLVALLAVNLGLVVRVTPGNIGVFELAYASAAHALGAPMAAAIGVGMLIHFVQDLPTIALGLTLGHGLVLPVGGRAVASPVQRLPEAVPIISRRGGILP